MADDHRGEPSPPARPDARRSVARDADRLSRREPDTASFWRSLAVLGTIGWSVALPTACGGWLGHALDQRFASGVRFTLILVFAGVLLGSAIAWRAVREHES